MVSGGVMSSEVGRRLVSSEENMKADDLRQMSDEQLDLTLREMVKNLFHLRFQSATDRLETPSEVQKAKRDVARVKTVMLERVQGIRGQKPTQAS
jgi:large subunit ribosomal protein L29